MFNWKIAIQSIWKSPALTRFEGSRLGISSLGQQKKLTDSEKAETMAYETIGSEQTKTHNDR